MYDDDLTYAFMAAAARLLRPAACDCCCRCARGCCRGAAAAAGCGGGSSTKQVFVALEKRFNFTLRDLVLVFLGFVASCLVRLTEQDAAVTLNADRQCARRGELGNMDIGRYLRAGFFNGS